MTIQNSFVLTTIYPSDQISCQFFFLFYTLAFFFHAKWKSFPGKNAGSTARASLKKGLLFLCSGLGVVCKTRLLNAHGGSGSRKGL